MDMIKMANSSFSNFKIKEKVSVVRIKPTGFILGDEILGTSIECVFLVSFKHKVYYVGSYTPSSNIQPVCFALQDIYGGELKPHEKAVNPQHENCAGCTHNQWGSSSSKTGKKCSDRIDLYIHHNNIVSMISIPPSSISVFMAYMSTFKEDEMHQSSIYNNVIQSAVTKISIVPDKVSVFKLQFSNTGKTVSVPSLNDRIKEAIGYHQSV